MLKEKEPATYKGYEPTDDERRAQIEQSLRSLFKNTYKYARDGEQYAWFTRAASLPLRVKIEKLETLVGERESYRDLWLTSEGYIGKFGVDLFHTQREAAQASLPALEAEEALVYARIGFLKDQRAMIEKYIRGDDE